jgi:hypothetical protein
MAEPSPSMLLHMHQGFGRNEAVSWVNTGKGCLSAAQASGAQTQQTKSCMSSAPAANPAARAAASTRQRLNMAKASTLTLISVVPRLSSKSMLQQGRP